MTILHALLAVASGSVVGFTLGLAYPMPITLNFGYPLQTEDGDVRQTFSFTIGTR